MVNGCTDDKTDAENMPSSLIASSEISEPTVAELMFECS
jgi:hypothetical protein